MKLSTESYQDYINRKFIIILILFILLLIVSLFSIKVGATNLSFKEIVLSIFFDTKDSSIIWNIRISRIVVAIVAGIFMGVEGTILQCVLRNPLASPYTMGISQGAAFGASFSIIILGAGTLYSSQADAVILNNPYLTVFFAFLGALIGVVAIIIISKIRNLAPEVMILAGVAMSALFSAGTMFLQYFASDTQVAATIFWTFGDVSRAVWNDFWIMLIILIPSISYFIYHSWDYNSLSAGETTAKSFGINTEKIRLIGLLLSSFTSALTVAFLGVIGFVGLIAPHIMRRILGNDHRFLIPSSGLLGALILLISDTLSRLILAPIILPVGIITAFMGAPMFLYIIIKMRY
ncbi:FecCD family ABC transporter permease [Methanobrevibacter olleyae]|uniref:Iron ABC transporter permease protein n=1 Tax=Methanobrevibacter olleyae TaxID=294671 RepID=A0A126R1F4_METOL|nr:iron ABC transporter permease [Methanobrevibacter olleyae]AMK15902.1 iron ABC transporter permease protein [Methanobrevibacter olleyae]SFL15050.1 iron complex transport system permease protein [Methanobrevibacter olleyae]